MKSENTGAGIFKVGEKTIPTNNQSNLTLWFTISDSHLVLIRSQYNPFEMLAHNT